MSSIAQSVNEAISRLTSRRTPSSGQGVRQSGVGRKVMPATKGANVLRKDNHRMLLGVLLLGVAGVGGYFLAKNLGK
uniref:Uncharacterized protein n=1 Tax=viral metagenome TaxID=1070528 RepID=A0A6C0BLV3_9ZZZZ